eukprot:NODE_443_length_7346_cov_1.066648.p7 type:complete len:105 gc:universal NODE_443_length_7346_cov_1.066648:7051-6737(-)
MHILLLLLIMNALPTNMTIIDQPNKIIIKTNTTKSVKSKIPKMIYINGKYYNSKNPHPAVFKKKKSVWKMLGLGIFFFPGKLLIGGYAITKWRSIWSGLKSFFR